MKEKDTVWARIWARIFGSDSRLPRRLENVLSYVVHRLEEGGRLEEVVREEYVRRQASADEIERVIADPRIVEAARRGLHSDFGSEDLFRVRTPRRNPG